MATVAAPPPNEFEVALICPLKLEVDACRAAFTKTYHTNSTDYKIEHHVPLISDTNDYYFGKIHEFNVLLCRPGDERGGQRVAATAYHDLKNTFRRVKYLFLVGVAGGVPKEANDPDIRLGDVVIGLPSKGNAGVTQINGGWQMDASLPKQTTYLHPPNSELIHWAKEVITNHETPDGKYVGRLSETVALLLKNLPNTQLPTGLTWKHPGLKNDILFPPDYRCKSQVDVKSEKDWCPAKCDESQQIRGRPERVMGHKVQTIHRGLICSVDVVVMNAGFRDETAKKIHEVRDRGEVLCYEMEGYGISETVSILQVRGICDYSDKHKTKRWQPYAALQAAAVTRLILDDLSLSNNQFRDRARTPLRANTRYQGSSIIPGNIQENNNSGTAHGIASLLSGGVTAEPLEIVDEKDFSLKRRFTDVHYAIEKNQLKGDSKYLSKSVTSPDSSQGGIGQTSRSGRGQTHRKPDTESDHDITENVLEPYELQGGDHTSSENSGSRSIPCGSHQLKRDSSYLESQSGDWRIRTPWNLEPPEEPVAPQKHPDRPSRISKDETELDEPIRANLSKNASQSDVDYKAELIKPVETNQSKTSDLSEESAVIDRGATVPEFYRVTGSFPRKGIVHKCRFKVYIKELDDTRDYPRYQTTKHGSFRAEWTIEDCELKNSDTISKRLSFHLLNGEDHLRFWVPVDAVTLVELEDNAGKPEYLYCWSDCEACNIKRKNHWSYPYFCYNASKPNIKLLIRFDNLQAEIDFRTLMLNQDLEHSMWEPLREPNSANEMMDRAGRSLKLYGRKPTNDRSIPLTDTLIAAFNKSDDGSYLKLYLFEEFNVSVQPSEAKSVFKITGLKVLNYSTRPFDQEQGTRYQSVSEQGEPVRQWWGTHEENSFFTRKNPEREPCVILPYKVFGTFLDIVLSWSMRYYTVGAKLLGPRSRFAPTSIEGPIILGHNKDPSSKCHLLCYEIGSGKWHIFEIEKPQTESFKEKGKDGSKKQISLSINKWTTRETMAVRQFNNLDKSATYRTIEFSVDDECENFCDALRASGVWSLRRSDTRGSSIRSKR